MTAARRDGGTPVAPGGKDPIRALLAAERDGLLGYVGYSAGDRYEVVLADETRELPLADVVPTVERLRAVRQLATDGIAARLVSVNDSTYVLDVDGRRRELPAGDVPAWCSGYAAACHGQGQEHAGEDHLGDIRSVLRSPSLSDQCRIAILGLMHGGQVTVSTPELAAKVGRTKKNVIEALAFGNNLDMQLADRMIEAFGLRWRVSAVGGEVFESADGGATVEQLPRMPGIARLERIIAAADQGLVRYVGEPSPNKARWTKRFELAVGDRMHTVEASGLDAWLDGVAAFHDRAADGSVAAG